MMQKRHLTIVLGLALAACANEPEFVLGPTMMDCEQDSCLVTFSVTNSSAKNLPLVYDITLSEDPISGPIRSGLIAVGAAVGEVNVAPDETKTVEVEVDVSATPAGSKISVFDARTPEFIRRILGS